MSRYILLVLAFMIPLSIFAQDTLTAKKKSKPRVYLDASAGVSIPLGNYAGDDPKNDASGFATTGYFINVNADWMGKGDFGIAFHLGYQNNPMKDTAKTVILSGSEPIGDGNWSNIFLMAGPVFVKQLKKLSADVKLLGGFIISTSPVFRTYNPETKMNESSTGTGFALGLNVGIGYKVSAKATVKFTLGYSAGFPKVDKQYNAYVIGIDSITGQYIYSAPSDIERKRTVSSLNAGAGFIYKF